MRKFKLILLLFGLLLSTSSCNIFAMFRGADDAAKAVVKSVKAKPKAVKAPKHVVKPKTVQFENFTIDSDKLKEEVATYLAENAQDLPSSYELIEEDFKDWLEAKYADRTE
ncbi:MAG: hypothetical protein AAF969_16200 [Bacteroidota bacterium]